ncbi:MAG: (2Fe-2S)-binding protein [Moorella humiferrea]|nr:(2Fe-2S)-binding protein [Moorella humiferrea]
MERQEGKKMINLTIDGRQISVPEGTTILEAAKKLGIYIPALCYHPLFRPLGYCRVCLVAIEGAAKPVTACNTPVAEGIVVYTSTPEIEEWRKDIVKMLLSQRPVECIREVERREPQRLNRFVIADPNRCLGCYTCMGSCVLIHNEQGLRPFPRLFVTQTAEGTMPIQCRHCEDAPCARVCPVKAIEIRDNMVVLNEGLCIGCKMCALVCPFGCIEFQGTLEGAGLINPHLSPLLNGAVGQKPMAIKCDLCAFADEGPACVRVCPNGALRVVEAEEMERMSELKRSASVTEVVSILRGGR